MITMNQDETGRYIVPDDVAREGAELAERRIRADRHMESAIGKVVHLQCSRLKRDKKQLPAAQDDEALAREAYRVSRQAADKFHASYGLTTVEAWQAFHGQYWPYYRVDSGSDRTLYYISESRARKTVS
jgi:hypothetical protein